MQFIQSIVSPPTFANEEKQLKAKTLYVILLSFLIGAILATGLAFYLDNRNIVAVLLSGMPFVLGALFIAKHGYLELAGAIGLTCLIIVVFLLQIFGRGVHDVAIMLYPIVIVIATILLRGFWIWLITAVSVFANGVIAYLQLTGRLAIDAPRNNLIADFIFISIILIVLAVAMNRLVANLWQYLRRARQNEEALLQGNRILEVQKTTLQKSEEEARKFQEKLQALHEVGFELAKIETLPELYRSVIVLGRESLGFDRLGLLLFDPETNTMRGTFGTDDFGNLRDERYFEQELKSKKIFDLLEQKTRLGYWAGSAIIDNGEVIGQGWNAMAILWQGDRGVGWLAIDNYIRKEPPTQMLLDLLTLYAGTVGHLMSVKEAETNMQKYAQELERSNKELQDFAFVSSHDLQEPLRKIQAFSDRLMYKYDDVLDERGLSYLSRMQNAAARMQTLIQDVLAFSKVNTAQDPFTDVNLNEIVQGVISDLEVLVEELDADIMVDDLPTLEADSTQMRQLFQNIISNALKFHKPNEAPLIKIGAYSTVEGEQMVSIIEVTDNGIGFDQQYVNRIFGMFQRLNSKSKFEGSGVGLTVCKRIIERHNGRIEAESQKDEGSKFIITLPMKQAANEKISI